MVEITSSVLQSLLLGHLLFCIFINDLPDTLKFSDPFVFAVDLKVLSVGNKFSETQEDLDNIERWVIKNKMELATNKCAQVTFRGKIHNHTLMNESLPKVKNLRDLRVLS